ncbi:MAG: hypothetical protein RR214_01880 [Synergistaceae bacterium]
MNNSLFSFAKPLNEPSMSYGPGCPERELLKEAIKQITSEQVDIPIIINGEEIRTGNVGRVVMPHDHSHVLASYCKAGRAEVQAAAEAALASHDMWSSMAWTERR